MSQDTSFSTQWVDIISPVPPETNSLLIWSTAILIGVLLSLLFYFFWWKRPEQLARRKINNLIPLIDSQQCSNKSLLKQLEVIIRQRYKVSFLSKNTIRNENWPGYFAELHKACYQPDVPGDQHTLLLINQAKSFIR